MKRTKSIIALLILITALILTGCTRDADVENPEEDKGSWETRTFTQNKTESPAYHWSSTSNEIVYPSYFSTNSGTQTIKFDFDGDDRTAAVDGTHDLYAAQPDENQNDTWKNGYYRTNEYRPYSFGCAGFEVSIKKTSGYEKAPFGVDFNTGSTSSGVGGFYRLTFFKHEDDGTMRWAWKLAYYQQNSSGNYVVNGQPISYYTDDMNPYGQANTIKVRTRNDNKFEILINGQTQGVITGPNGAPTSGTIYTIAAIGFEDTVVANDPDPVVVTWNFNKFQIVSD